MSIHYDYQAVPADVNFFDEHRSEDDTYLLCRAFSEIRSNYLHPDHPSDEPESDPEAAARGFVSSLLSARPLLATRNCDLDRRWDMVNYLLSANRRESSDHFAQPNIFDIACLGEAKVLDDYVYRYTSPVRTATVAAAFAEVEPAALRAHYDLERMQAAGVHKSSYEWMANPEYVDYICGLVVELKMFYSSAAEHAEGVLVRALN